jgi:hypothetical protein
MRSRRWRAVPGHSPSRRQGRPERRRRAQCRSAREPFQRCDFAELRNLFRSLVQEKELSAHGTGGGNAPAAQLIRENSNQPFNAGLRGDICAIGWKRLGKYAAGKEDNASAQLGCAIRAAQSSLCGFGLLGLQEIQQVVVHLSLVRGEHAVRCG